MILSTTDVLQGVAVTSYLGIVTAEVVYGSNALRDFFAGIRDMIGGAQAATNGCLSRGNGKRSLNWKNEQPDWGQMRWWALKSTLAQSTSMSRGFCS